MEVKDLSWNEEASKRSKQPAITEKYKRFNRGKVWMW